MEVLFLGKKHDAHCARALDFTQQLFPKVTARMGSWGDPFDKELVYGKYFAIISYLSRWIVPPSLLSCTDVAINFHPASPSYPGIGCNNFALYDEVSEYGVTCHFMAPSVDTGEIIETRRFAVFPSDDVTSLLRRTYDHQLILFYDIVGKLAAGEILEPSGEKWERKAFTRREFNELATLTPDMSQQEMQRRMRACVYEKWRPQMHLNGFVFESV